MTEIRDSAHCEMANWIISKWESCQNIRVLFRREMLNRTKYYESNRKNKKKQSVICVPQVLFTWFPGNMCPDCSMWINLVGGALYTEVTVLTGWFHPVRSYRVGHDEWFTTVFAYDQTKYCCKYMFFGLHERKWKHRLEASYWEDVEPVPAAALKLKYTYSLHETCHLDGVPPKSLGSSHEWGAQCNEPGHDYEGVCLPNPTNIAML